MLLWMQALELGNVIFGIGRYANNAYAIFDCALWLLASSLAPLQSKMLFDWIFTF